MAIVRNRFKILLAEKEYRDGRDYSYRDIARLTGVSPNTIGAYKKGTVTRFDQPTIVALCNWLECDLSDLIEYGGVPEPA